MTEDVWFAAGDVPPERLRHLASTLRELCSAREVDEALQLMVNLAVDVLSGVEVVSVMFVQSGQIITPVLTDEVAVALDEAQQEAGEGPCLTALRDETSAVSHDLEQEDRWPGFTPRALDLGVRSVAAYRLFRDTDGQDVYGALNMFGTRPGFDDHDLRLGEVFAAYCSAVLASAIQEEGMEVALLSRELIGQAKGILMVRHDLNPDDAYIMLHRAAAEHDIEIHVLASQIVAGATTLR